jgi:hypothetical protein
MMHLVAVEFDDRLRHLDFRHLSPSSQAAEKKLSAGYPTLARIRAVSW